MGKGKSDKNLALCFLKLFKAIIRIKVSEFLQQVCTCYARYVGMPCEFTCACAWVLAIHCSHEKSIVFRDFLMDGTVVCGSCFSSTHSYLVL